MPRFSIDKVFHVIEKEKIKLFTGVPTMYLRMSQYPLVKSFDVSSVNYWISGASPSAQVIRNQFEKQFNIKIIEGYGLTESTSGFALQRINRTIKPNSVGQALPNIEVGVLDEKFNILQQGEIGELGIKGPNVMKGYYKMEEETEKVLKQGWLKTGDIGYIDEDGDIFIVERKKDLIITGGFNVYPCEVEEVLYEHPAILEAGVIGVPNKEMGEVVKAFVTLKQSKTVEEDIKHFCKKKLTKYKVPRSVNFLLELPKDDLGKVLRRELRKFH